ITVSSKKLKGLATTDELHELQLWLDSDAANRQEYDETVAILNASVRLLTARPFDSNTAWLKVNQAITHIQIAHVRKPPATIISILFRKQVAVAIAILAVLIIGGFWWFSRSQWKTYMANSHNQWLLLTNRTMVMLRNGSTIRYPRVF